MVDRSIALPQETLKVKVQKGCYDRDCEKEVRMMLKLSFQVDPYLNLFYHFELISSKMGIPPNEPFRRLRRDVMPPRFYNEFRKLDLTLLDYQKITSLICGEGISALHPIYQDVMNILKQGYTNYVKYWDCKIPFLEKFIRALSELWQRNGETFTARTTDVTGLQWPNDEYTVSIVDAFSKYSKDTNGMGTINLVDKSLILLGVDEPGFSLRVLMMELIHYLLEECIKDSLKANDLPHYLSFFFNETFTPLVLSTVIESTDPLRYPKVLFTEIFPLGDRVNEIIDDIAQKWHRRKENLGMPAFLQENLRNNRESLKLLDVIPLKIFFPERSRL